MDTEQSPMSMEENRKEVMIAQSGSGGHMMSPDDPDNPQNWPFLKKVYASSMAFGFAFVVAFGITVYTTGLKGVMQEFDVSMPVSILGMALYFWGIAFAPIITPHLSERVGRTKVYLATIPIFALFTLGAGYSRNFASLVICRFFAGLFGGPSLVLIEGTFADVWSASLTVTYYSFLGLASYIGAACGPLIGGFVVGAENWRWSQYLTLMLALAVYLLGIGVPETYGREILRSRARRRGLAPPNLTKALSGVTFAEMARVTFFTPLKMLIAEPVVMLITLYLGLNFAVIFQFFITVPIVLNVVAGFTVQQAGLAFNAAIGGAVIAAMTSILIDRIAFPRAVKNGHNGMASIEYRLIPAMFGGFGLFASLFWIGFTAKPTISYISPVLGTGLYVWGNLSVLISFISYLFDAYPPAGTLSALTVAATFRIIMAGLIPLVIVQMFTNLQGKWALAVFGFIYIAMIPIPFILYIFGPKLRARSKYSEGMMMMSSEDGMKPVNSHSQMMMDTSSGQEARP
ncbi:hypothetical protein MMC20_000447 [Loxospora ochrophaea]|nr:hypothetical protein [Loxospora ochrophaea]